MLYNTTFTDKIDKRTVRNSIRHLVGEFTAYINDNFFI